MSDMIVLAERLYERRATGSVVPYKMLDPTHVEGQCHKNAGFWARDNPGWKIIHGWLVFDYEKDTGGILPIVRFNPHSVVEDSRGERLDPTPSRASQQYPFLEHEGNPEDFIDIVEGNWISIIEYNLATGAVKVS